MGADNRRGFLRGLATLPLIGGGVVAAYAQPTTDAGLLAMKPVIEAKLAAYERALEVFGQAERAFFAEVPDQPVFDQLHHRTVQQPYRDDYTREWNARTKAYKAEAQRLSIKHDTAAKREAYEALEDDFVNSLEAVAEARATTIEGLKFKAAMAEHDDDVKDSVIRDLLALPIGAWAT